MAILAQRCVVTPIENVEWSSGASGDPEGNHRQTIDKLSTNIARILAVLDIQEKLVSQGMQPFTSTPEQFAALIKADLAKYAKIIKAANIKLE